MSSTVLLYGYSVYHLSFFGIHAHSNERPQPTPKHHVSFSQIYRSYTKALLASPNRRHLFVNPWCQAIDVMGCRMWRAASRTRTPPAPRTHTARPSRPRWAIRTRWCSGIHYFFQLTINYSSSHRLNMELDLQSLFGLHVTWCAQLFSSAETQQPLPPCVWAHLLGLIYDGRYPAICQLR